LTLLLTVNKPELCCIYSLYICMLLNSILSLLIIDCLAVFELVKISGGLNFLTIGARPILCCKSLVFSI